MKVKELITLLENLPDDTEVVFDNSADEYGLGNVRFVHYGYNCKEVLLTDSTADYTYHEYTIYEEKESQ